MHEVTRRRGHQEATAIVVGTDFSPASGDAIARATEIARRTGATLHLVHATRRLPAALARAFGVTDERTTSRMLDGFVAEVRKTGARARGHLLRGGAVEALRAQCRALGAALVVVGARGRTVPDAAIGSTAERVASGARCPVLLVRRKVGRPYRDVVIAADRGSNVAAALAAARLVADGARVRVLHAYAPPFETTLALQGATAADLQAYRRQARQEALRAMTEAVVGAGLDPSCLVLQHGDARRVLTGVERMTLLVVDRGRSVAEHALLGSVTRWVVAYGTSDVVLV